MTLNIQETMTEDLGYAEVYHYFAIIFHHFQYRLVQDIKTLFFPKYHICLQRLIRFQVTKPYRLAGGVI